MESRLDQAKSVDLYSYLSEQGHNPVRETTRKAWYLSPKRTENVPSFEVDRVRNRWSDHGEEKAFGDVIDWVVWMEACSKGDAIDKILGVNTVRKYHKRDIAEERKLEIEVLEVSDEITNESIIEYMEQVRKLPIALVSQYYKQVIFQFASSKYSRHYGIGMPNDNGGWSLKSAWFKGSTRPAGITTTTSANHETVNVYEGGLDFLSHIVLRGRPQNVCIILNSLTFIPMITDTLRSYKTRNMYLDNDGAADQKLEYLLQENITFDDRRGEYSKFNDINDYLVSL